MTFCLASSKNSLQSLLPNELPRNTPFFSVHFATFFYFPSLDFSLAQLCAPPDLQRFRIHLDAFRSRVLQSEVCPDEDDLVCGDHGITSIAVSQKMSTGMLPSIHPSWTPAYLPQGQGESTASPVVRGARGGGPVSGHRYSLFHLN